MEPLFGLDLPVDAGGARFMLAAFQKAMAIGQGESEIARFREYRDDPNLFAKRVLGVRSWEGQRYFLDSVWKHQKVAWRGPRGVGKTFAESILVPAFLCTRSAIVLTLSSGGRAMKAQLWGEIATRFNNARAALPGHVDTMQWKIGPKHYAMGMMVDNAGSATGFHAGREAPEDPDRDLTPDELQAMFELAASANDTGTWLLILLDEAQTHDDSVIQAFLGSIQGPRSRIVMCGNPLMSPDAEHEFARAFKDDSGWHRIHVSYFPAEDPVGADRRFDHVPNWVTTGDAWALDRKKHWWDNGSNRARYLSDVLGQFSADSIENIFVPRALLVASAKGAAAWHLSGDLADRHIGWDVAASESGDDNVLAFMDTGKLVRLERWKGKDVLKSADHVVARWRWFGKGDTPPPGRNLHVDATGVGAGAVSHIRRLGIPCDAVDFGAAPANDWPLLTEEMRFATRKAQLMWILRRALQERLVVIPDEAWAMPVWQQAAWHSYEDRKQGVVSKMNCRETKDDIRRLHGRSPDDFDAVLVCMSRESRAGVSRELVFDV